MSDSTRSLASQQSATAPLTPDLVLRVGFAGKRQLDAAQTETVPTRLRDVFSVIGWRLVEISPLDDATKERPVPAIAKFYSHKRPTLRLIHGLCEGAASIASEVRISFIQNSKTCPGKAKRRRIKNPQSEIRFSQPNQVRKIPRGVRTSPRAGGEPPGDVGYSPNTVS